jgi:hypothetical protein
VGKLAVDRLVARCGSALGLLVADVLESHHPVDRIILAYAHGLMSGSGGPPGVPA